jgi:uncharacterized protein YjiS (DUF1127 family)
MKMNATATNDNFANAGKSAVFARIGTVLRSLVTFPQRRAVRDELSNLTDRELADIGLSRADVAHVFDAEFVTRRERAQENLRAARRATC